MTDGAPLGAGSRVGAGDDAGLRTLVGGVGYRFLRDFSVGPVLADRLADRDWPPGVRVEDLGYGPVAVAQRLQDAPPSLRRLVVVGAAERGRAPGTVTVWRWDRSLPPRDEIQARVSEAVTGVVDLDNLVVVVGALGAAPPEVVVVEVEPEVEEHGLELSPAVRRGTEEAERWIHRLAGGPLPDGIPSAPPGGP